MVTRERRYPRRRFILQLGLTAATLSLLNTVTPTPDVSAQTPPSSAPAVSHDIRPVISIAGMHDAPNDGGSIYPERLVKHASELKVGHLATINPSEALLEATRHLSITARLYTEGNQFDAAKLMYLIRKIKAHTTNPARFVIKHVNEPNIENNSGSNKFSASRMLEDLYLPGAMLIAREGGISIFPPLAQDTRSTSKVNEYNQEMLNELPKHASSDWIKENVVLGLHNYIPDFKDFMARKDTSGIWDWPRYISQMFENKVGFKPTLYITEAGLNRTLTDGVTDKEAALALEKFLKSPLPNDLDIRTLDIWLYANFAQRPPEHARANSKFKAELARFELASIYQAATSGDGLTPSYLTWAELAHAMR